MESNSTASNPRWAVRRTQRSKKLSESSTNSTNDSGYSSEVFTSPEFTRSTWNSGLPAESSIKSYLAFDGPVTRTRLTSTPQSTASSNSQEFAIPSPKLNAIKKSLKSDCESSSESLLSPSIDESELEIISKKPSASSQNIRPLISRSSVLRQTSLKSTVQIRKPQNVLLRLLKDADYLVYQVLKHLCAQDLISVTEVNRQLRDIVFGNKELNNRRVTLITNRRNERQRVGKENFRLKRLNDGAGTSLGKTSPRKRLGEVQNVMSDSERKAAANFATPVVTLADKFIEEGKKLPPGEELQKCVKCKAPANVQKSIFRAICSSSSCGYDYCMRCYLPSHRKAQDCSVLKPRTRNSNGIFSKKCKKSLRRL